MKTGGGTQTVTADLPADWRRQMDDEMRDALKALDADKTIDREGGEFTVKEAIGIWRESLGGTKKYVARLVEAGELSVRYVYDPECKMNVNAYKVNPSDTAV